MIMTTMVPVKCLDTFYYTYLPNEKYDRNATLFCPDCSAVWANLATMPTFPAELASSNSPPKSWAWCKHSWAKPNSHLLMASSANCFHFCSTKVMGSNPVHVKVYTIQHYVIKFVSDLRQVGIFIRLLRFPLNENYLKPKFILWYVLYIHNYYWVTLFSLVSTDRLSSYSVVRTS
jgi:hypothetical protein